MTTSTGDLLLAATPGFRFYPTEDELLGFYLRHHLTGTTGPHVHRVIPVVDVYSHHPSHLPTMAGEANVRDAEQWFFFCPRAERETRGGRTARTTPSGYWKATGSPSSVFSSSSAATASASSKVIGVKRTMVFYQGRASAGSKTTWKMNEYKAVADDEEDDGNATAQLQKAAPLKLRNEFSLCRVYVSTGTLRSFDRRPLNPPTGNARTAAHRQHAPSAANTNPAKDRVTAKRAKNSQDWRSLITSTSENDSFIFDMDFNQL